MNSIDTRRWLNDWLEEHGMTTTKQMRRMEIEAALRDYTEDACREALEEACRAVCLWCAQETPVGQPGANGSYWHPIPAVNQPAYCHATPIRALLDKEPTP